MELEIKTVPVEVKGFKPDEVAKLTYDTKTVTAVLKEAPNKSEALDWLDDILSKPIADIAVVCAICAEETPMNSNDCRAHGVFICDKCKAAIKHVRNILENGGSVT
jgi:superfamily II helicase